MQYSINKLIRAGFMLWFASCNVLYSKNMIVLPIQGYTQHKTKSEEKIIQKIETPGAISRTILKYQFLKPGIYDGIFATYGGYIAVSNYDGIIMFPRKHMEPEVKLLITPSIKPIFMLNNIIHHWNINPNQPAQMFHISLYQDDETELYYWRTTPVDTPADQRVPLDSIVIFAKPKNIVVPVGATLTTKGGHLILPPVYAKKELDRKARALTVENIRIFLEPITYETQQNSDLYRADQTTNQ